MSLTKKRWIVLVASCLVNFCIGSLYAWSVFSVPMAQHIGMITGTIPDNMSVVFTVANSVGPITMIAGGFINDKIGPRWVIVLGGILFGSGMLLCGFAKSVVALILAYGLGVGLGVGMVYGCTVSNIVKFFPDRRGLAGGIATASYGISSAVFPPIANALIFSLNVTVAFQLLGVSMLVLICSSAFLVERCPRDFQPDGWTRSPEQQDEGEGKNWRAMLKSPLFYVMLIVLCCGAFSGLMIISQASPLAQRMLGMTAIQAATAVSVLALLNTFGRILAGFLADKISFNKTLRTIFLTSAGGLMLLYALGGICPFFFFVGIGAVGLAFGSIMGIYPGFTAAQFGTKDNSVNYGIMFVGFAAAGYFGPTIMSALFAKTQTDKPAFLIAASLAALGFLLTHFFGLLVKPSNSVG